MMDLDAYLRRIAYDGPLRPDRESLFGLHQAHLLAIPYENLDVQFGRRVTIDPSHAFEKIVTHKRGGWCYEMNGLFGWVLGQLGFKVTRVAGAVMRSQRGDDAFANHLVLKVELDEGLFLADVGFGDGPLEPIAITPGPFVSHGFGFAVSREDERWWRFHNHKAGGSASFDFHLDPADEALLAQRCHSLQSEPDSPFVQNAVLQHHFENGIWQMRGRVLRQMTPEGEKDFIIESASEYVGVLSEMFKLELKEAADLWPKICARHEELEAARQS